MKHKMNDTKPTRTQILTTFRKLLFSDDQIGRAHV